MIIIRFGINYEYQFELDIAPLPKDGAEGNVSNMWDDECCKTYAVCLYLAKTSFRSSERCDPVDIVGVDV